MCVTIVQLQLSGHVVVSETVRYPGDAVNYQYDEWVKNLTIPAVQVSDSTAYRCTVRTGGLSNHADYRFTIVGKLAFVALWKYFINSFDIANGYQEGHLACNSPKGCLRKLFGHQALPTCGDHRKMDQLNRNQDNELMKFSCNMLMVRFDLVTHL